MTINCLAIAPAYINGDSIKDQGTSNGKPIAAEEVSTNQMVYPVVATSVRQLVQKLYDRIQALEAQGYTYPEICKLLKRQLGIEVAANTLRGYFSNERTVRKRRLGKAAFIQSKSRMKARIGGSE